MTACEYLCSYGTQGDFGRFYPVRPLHCRRGDNAVVESCRGLELASVLCEATPGHARFLPNTSVGRLLRLAEDEDHRAAERMRQHGQHLFEDSRRLATELGLPLEILDVEVLLDGRQAVVYHLPWAECDVRPLVSALSRTHDLFVALHPLAPPQNLAAEEDYACGRPDCGLMAGGGSACGSDGGCSTCRVSAAHDPMACFEKFQQARTPLL